MSGVSDPANGLEALRARRRTAAPDTERRLTESLIEHFFSYEPYFPDPVSQFLETEDGRIGLRQHLFERLDNNRSSVIPWIVEIAGDLRGKSVVEIGCGTGSTTVALAEQGASVRASDPHEGSLRVAEERLRCYGLSADLMNSDAEGAFRSLGDERVDVVAFLAVLEHMTLEERLRALRQAWAHLKPGGWLVIDETPNRLWHFDYHTAHEPFFLWLPDDLAALYSSRTRRARYNRLHRNNGKLDPVTLARWGRGVSYHDFVVALDLAPEALPVVSSKDLFFRAKTGATRGVLYTEDEEVYEKLIRALAPEVPAGFFTSFLDLILQKPLDNAT